MDNHLKISEAELLNEYQEFSRKGGYFLLPCGVLRIKGHDAQDFLHRLTSQHIKVMQDGQRARGALLQPNSMVLSLFDIILSAGVFYLVTDLKHLEVTHQHLEKMHFAEDLEITDVSEQFKVLAVAGAPAEASLDQVRALRATEFIFTVKTQDLAMSWQILAHLKDVQKVTGTLDAAGIPKLSENLWNLLMINAGHFVFGRDITEKNLILEAPAEEYIHRDKGCYPGQEIVERVFTYGNVAKKLMGIKVQGTPVIERGAPIRATEPVSGAEKDAGAVTSVTRVPWNQTLRVFAMVKKPFYNSGQDIKVGESAVRGIVEELPHTIKKS